MTKYYQHIFCSLYELNISFLMLLKDSSNILLKKKHKRKIQRSQKIFLFCGFLYKKKFEREYILANFSFQNSRDFFS